MCFMDLEKVLDHVPMDMLCGGDEISTSTLQEYWVQLTCPWSKRLAFIAGGLFPVRVGLCQGCPFLFDFRDRISGCSQGAGGIWIVDLREIPASPDPELSQLVFLYHVLRN